MLVLLVLLQRPLITKVPLPLPTLAAANTHRSSTTTSTFAKAAIKSGKADRRLSMIVVPVVPSQCEVGHRDFLAFVAVRAVSQVPTESTQVVKPGVAVSATEVFTGCV